MPIKYLSSDYAVFPDGPSLTEQEHKDSCDINKMVKNATRGLQVRGGKTPQYGHDDLTLDAVQFRIQKEKIEQSLSETAHSHEFSSDELKHIPNDVKQKFKFRTKAEQKTAPKNDNLNDDKKGDPPLTAPADSEKP